MRWLVLWLAFFVSAVSAQTVRISGSVLTREGKPLEAATIRLNIKDAAPIETVTRSQGAFEIDAPPAESYSLLVAKEGFVATSATVNRSRPSTVIRLYPTAVITGRVFDTAGNPIRDAEITAFVSSYVGGTRWLMAVSIVLRTDANGVYRYQSSGRGPFYLRVEAKGFGVTTYYPSALDPVGAVSIAVEPGATQSGIDIHQRVEPVFRVCGKAVDESGAPAANAALNIFSEQPVESFMPAAPVRTATDGSFEFTGLLPGLYVIRAIPNEQLEAKYAGRINVAVVRDDVDDVRLIVNKGFTFSGVMEMEDGSALPGPSVRWPGSERTVEIHFLDLIDIERASFANLTANPELKDGTFRIEHIPPGKYQLTYQRRPERLYIKSISHGGQKISSQLDLTYGSIDNARIVIGTNAGQVSATVRNRNGEAIPGVFVSMWSASASADVAETNENGSILFDIVPPGKYYLAAFEGISYPFVQIPDFLEHFKNRAVEIEVGKGASVERTLEPISREDAAAVIRNLP